MWTMRAYLDIIQEATALLLQEGDGDAYFAGHNVDMVLQDVRDPHSRSTIAYMTPQTFLKLAEPGIESSKTDLVAHVGKTIGKFSSLPRLLIGTNARGETQVGGHEGRHRMRWLAERGVHEVPVEIRHSTLRWGENPERPAFLISEMEDYRCAMPRSVIFPGHD